MKEPILTLKNKIFFWIVKILKPSYSLMFYHSAVIMCNFWQKQKGKVVTDKTIEIFAELLAGQSFKIMDTEVDGELPKYINNQKK